MLNVQKLYSDRAKDGEKYWEVVQGAWNRAFERFMKALNDPKGTPIRTGREMLDLWLATANGALVEMHRSKEFLEAQRRGTRSSTQGPRAPREIPPTDCGRPPTSPRPPGGRHPAAGHPERAERPTP